ncbi:hypothetical protein GCM10023146_41520 [Nocardioides caricicola]
MLGSAESWIVTVTPHKVQGSSFPYVARFSCPCLVVRVPTVDVRGRYSRTLRRVMTRSAHVTALLVIAALLATGAVRHGLLDKSRSRSHPDLSIAATERFTVMSAEGVPGRWDPCYPIRIVVDPHGAPPGVTRDIRTAADRLRAWTRLRFAVTVSRAGSASVWRARAAGGGWRPVMLSFVGRSSDRLSDPAALAEARPVWVTDGDGRSEFVTGSVAFNRSQVGLYGDGTDDRPTRLRLIEHELGHIVGLKHVHDPRSLMYPTLEAVGGLTSGDRKAMRRVGGTCARPPDTP